MSRTITAMFDDRADADAAKARLTQSNIDAGHISIHDKSSGGVSEKSYSTSKDPGMWGSIKNAFLPDEDRHTYEEGMRRGGYVLTVDVDEDQVDEAVRVLDEADSVDIDDRASQWRSTGWDYAAPAAGLGVATGLFGAGTTPSMTTATDTVGTSSDEQVIPIVQEELVVGKREVDRGGVRVRSYVTETPVHEQIALRNERINVERRPVDQKLSGADADAFRERTIDVTASGEEAVVGKTARVVEEVVVSKTSEEHVEHVDDKVRRTDVEIDRDAGEVETSGTKGMFGRDPL